MLIKGSFGGIRIQLFCKKIRRQNNKYVIDNEDTAQLKIFIFTREFKKYRLLTPTVSRLSIGFFAERKTLLVCNMANLNVTEAE